MIGSQKKSWHTCGGERRSARPSPSPHDTLDQEQTARFTAGLFPPCCRCRRAYAPTNNTASRDHHELSFLFSFTTGPHYEVLRNFEFNSNSVLSVLSTRIFEGGCTVRLHPQIATANRGGWSYTQSLVNQSTNHNKK